MSLTGYISSSGTYCECLACKKSCENDLGGHIFENSTCKICKHTCEHSWENGTCSTCGAKCSHNWNDGTCQTCWMSCQHPSWTNGKCSVCGYDCVEHGGHYWDDGVCSYCHLVCNHQWEQQDNGSGVFYQCRICGKYQ